MSGRVRVAIAIVIATIVGLGVLRREEGPGAGVTATFESTRHGQPFRRGAFVEGERVETPAGGRVLVRTGGGAQVHVEESSAAEFVSLDPVDVRLFRGRIVAQSEARPLTLHVGEHSVRLAEHAAAELSQAPPRLVVTSGTVTLNGRVVTGHRDLTSATSSPAAR